MPGSKATVDGAVNFEAAPGGRGTIVRVQMDYDFPGRSIAEPASWLLGRNPEQFANKALRRFNGTGKQSNSYVPNRPIEEALGYALTKRFRELLGEVA